MYVCVCLCVMGMTIHAAPYLQIKLFELFTKLQIHISTLEGYQYVLCMRSQVSLSYFVCATLAVLILQYTAYDCHE